MMKTTFMTLAAVLFTWTFLDHAQAQSNVGTFVATKGDVKVLREPGSSANGPYLIFEGKKYVYEEAKIGKKVRPDEIIQCGADGKAKVVYANGDHFVIAPGTSLVLPGGMTTNNQQTPTLKINYGKVRSLVTKGGAKEKLHVTTPTAVAGVRGTDFFVRHNPVEGTQLTVVRGEVVVKPREKDAEPVSVKKGFTAATKEAGALEVKETTKEELVEVQTESTLKVDPTAVATLPENVKQEIQKLNQATTQAVLEDVKKDDPKLYEELKKQDKVDAVTVHTVAVSNLFQNAPSETKKKPTREEIENIGKDVYEKYFLPGLDK